MKYKTLKEKIEEAVSCHSIESVVTFPPNKTLIVCPLPFHCHTHNSPSFSIFFKDGKQYWKCHGYCNREGDVIDLVGFLYTFLVTNGTIRRWSKQPSNGSMIVMNR
jgi:hypothetical protein